MVDGQYGPSGFRVDAPRYVTLVHKLHVTNEERRDDGADDRDRRRRPDGVFPRTQRLLAAVHGVVDADESLDGEGDRHPRRHHHEGVLQGPRQTARDVSVHVA